MDKKELMIGREVVGLSAAMLASKLAAEQAGERRTAEIFMDERMRGEPLTRERFDKIREEFTPLYKQRKRRKYHDVAKAAADKASKGKKKAKRKASKDSRRRNR